MVFRACSEDGQPDGASRTTTSKSRESCGSLYRHPERLEDMVHVLACCLLRFRHLICSGIAASSKQMGLPDRSAAIFSLLVVILTGTIGFIRPDDRQSRHRQAWSLLTVQLSRFLFDETYTLDHVIRAYEQGEAIIHQAPAAVPQQPSQAPAAP
jgi:hypothetical protein